jgi:hypothetical protein
MIDGLIGGKVYGKPTERVGASGKPFATAKVRTAVADGESLFVNVIVFDAVTKAALLALDDGDSVALVGNVNAESVDRPERRCETVARHGRALRDDCVSRKAQARSRRPGIRPEAEAGTARQWRGLEETRQRHG